MSLSLQSYYDYLVGLVVKQQLVIQHMKKADKKPVKKIIPKTFTTKKR